MTAVFRGFAARAFAAGFNSFHMGQFPGRMQQSSRFFSHDTSGKEGNHWITFQAPKIFDLLKEAQALQPSGLEEVRALRSWLATLMPLDQDVQLPDTFKSVESTYKVHGITFQLKQQTDPVRRQSELRIHGMQFNQSLVDKKIQNENLQKCWGPIHQALYTTNPRWEGVPGAHAPAHAIRTWMHANPSLLQGITSLSLSSLNLTCVPKEISLMTGLQGLFLSNNQLISLPPDLFHGMTRLQSLSLDNNQLTALPQGLFDGLSGLLALNLSHNQLCTLPPGLFKRLPQLRILNLESNQLTALPRGLFYGLNKLEQLLLYRNPHLLMSCSDFAVWGNHITFPGLMEDFFDYKCKSPLAKFYQLAAGNSTTAVVKEAFDHLDAKTKSALLKTPNPIFRLASIETDRPDADARQHVRTLNGALKQYVMTSYAEMTGDQKDVVCERLNVLTQTVSLWGSLHILRLIDVMTDVQNEAENKLLAEKKAQDENLQKCWGPIHQALQTINPLPAGIPDVHAPVEMIRTWMRANSQLLQGMTSISLSDLNLTCIPKEIESIPSLRKLFPDINQPSAVAT